MIRTRLLEPRHLLRMSIPIKQGLKQFIVAADGSAQQTQNEYSNKTRIETRQYQDQ